MDLHRSLVTGHQSLVGVVRNRLERSSADNFISDLIERKNFLGQASARDKAGHPPDDAGGLILNNHRRILHAQRFATSQPILSHPRENNAQRFRAKDFGDRTK